MYLFIYLCMYLCIYEFIYLFSYLFIYFVMYLFIYLFSYVCIYVHAHNNTHAYIRIHNAHTHARIITHKHARMYTCAHARIHMHTLTRTHTYAHTYTHIHPTHTRTHIYSGCMYNNEEARRRTATKTYENIRNNTDDDWVWGVVGVSRMYVCYMDEMWGAVWAVCWMFVMCDVECSVWHSDVCSVYLNCRYLSMHIYVCM